MFCAFSLVVELKSLKYSWDVLFRFLSFAISFGFPNWCLEKNQIVEKVYRGKTYRINKANREQPEVNRGVNRGP